MQSSDSLLGLQMLDAAAAASSEFIANMQLLHSV